MRPALITIVVATFLLWTLCHAADDRASTTRLARANGYTVDEESVTTSDGYILDVYRIPRGVSGVGAAPVGSIKRPVVLLSHGLSASSSGWVALSSDTSLAYILADQGFDVWLFNARGTVNGQRHQYLSNKDPKFWDFSVDEIALIDLPTTIDHVMARTGTQKIGLVGHSQGASTSFMLLSTRLEYAAKLWLQAHLAPVAFLQKSTALLFNAIADSHLDQVGVVLHLSELPVEVVSRITTPLCTASDESHEAPNSKGACIEFREAALGRSYLASRHDLNVIIDDEFTWPNPLSTKQLNHYCQIKRAHSASLFHYDYGIDCLTKLGRCNQLKYGSLHPPLYDLGRVQTPTAVFVGGKDVLSVPYDWEALRQRLPPGVLVHFEELPDYAHMDFIWYKSSDYQPELVRLVKQYGAPYAV